MDRPKEINYLDLFTFSLGQDKYIDHLEKDRDALRRTAGRVTLLEKENAELTERLLGRYSYLKEDS